MQKIFQFAFAFLLFSIIPNSAISINISTLPNANTNTKQVDSPKAQTEYGPTVDSLNHIIRESNPKNKPALLNMLTHYHIAGKEYKKAVEAGIKALELSAETDNTHQQHEAEKNIGIAYYLSSDFPNALIYLKKAIGYYEKINVDSTRIELARYLGGSYFYTGQYQQSYKQFLKCHEYFTSVHDTIELANTLGNIGNIYLKWREYDKALNYFTKALELGRKMNNHSGIATCYNNIANVHFETGDYDKTIEYNLKSMKISKEVGDSVSVATSYNNIAGVYFNQEKYNRALSNYKKALTIYKRFRDKKWMSMAYNNIGFTYEFLGETTKAIDNYRTALRLGRETSYTEQILFAYESFSEVYRSQGNYREAFHYLEKYRLLNDSVFNEEKHKQLAEMEARYENKQKQKEIEILNQEALLKEEKLKRKNYFLFGSMALILLLGLLVFYIWRSFRLKKTANKLLKVQNNEITEKNEELNQQREEIATQRDELEAQRDLLINQKNEIADVYQEINSSIKYASTIQRAFLPPATFIDQVFPDNFIYFRPKESVSGDFYWVEERDNIKIVAVADCTGHGVPGAFLSILGMTALNEIYHEYEELKASDFLNTLKKKVIQTLHQTHSDKHPRDSMEMSICLIDTKNKTINFSGSYNPLLLVQNNELKEIKADRLPIGYHPLLNHPFNDQYISYQEGDSMYMATDGYPDQKNHVTEKKFLKSRFKRLLLEIHQLPANEQLTQLASNFDYWKGASEQIDDVLVAGIRL